jgi:hypothetical protein
MIFGFYLKIDLDLQEIRGSLGSVLAVITYRSVNLFAFKLRCKLVDELV